MSEKLSDGALTLALDDMPGWKRVDDEIKATFTFVTFGDAVAFVNRVADLAEAADHHPDIDIRWNTVHLTLSTHSAGGLTQKDIDLAEQINDAAPE